MDSRKLAAEGLGYLDRRDYERALRLFNAAIKFDSENPAYHLLAAAAYHLQFLAGGAPEMRDDAEIGYQLAARYAPLDPWPWVQLGRLHLEAHDAAEAKDAFARAVTLGPDNLDALRGLATASYLSGDLVTALWSADEMERRHAEPAELNRYRAMFYAVLGDRARADRYHAAYAADPGVSATARATFGASLSRVDRMIDNQTWAEAPARVQRVQFASLPPPLANPFPAAQPGAAASQPPPAATSSPGVQPTAAVAPGHETPATGAAFPAWWNCPGAPVAAAPAWASQPVQLNTVDETQQLPALPPTCPGAPPPRMAMIDVVMVTTTDEYDRSYGLNLLQGLTGYFGYAANFTKAGGVTQKLKTTQFAFGGAGGPAAPLSYSLNIANAALSHDDIIARPTLMAIDRMPSTFFSGDSVAIAVGGGAGSVSSLNDRHVGISISITPTFLDDEHVLLGVKVAQSAVETPWVQATGVSLQQSRNMASASMVVSFGQTVILSGLTQRERARTDSGVPVLKGIPGLQYLFATSTPVDTYKTTMMLLTIRRPDDAGVARPDATGPAAAYPFDWRVRAYEQQIAAETPDLPTALARLNTGEMYRGFKASDLGTSPWAGPAAADGFTQALREMLAH